MADLEQAGRIKVEVLYALPQEQTLLQVDVPQDCAVEEAIRLSGILEKYPEIDLATSKFGIFGKACKGDVKLREKDRVEIYRPLIADPKEVRKRLAAEGKIMKKGGGEL